MISELTDTQRERERERARRESRESELEEQTSHQTTAPTPDVLARLRGEIVPLRLCHMKLAAA